MTPDCAPGTDAPTEEPDPATLARVLRGLRELPAVAALPDDGAGESGDRPDIPLPRRR